MIQRFLLTWSNIFLPFNFVVLMCSLTEQDVHCACLHHVWITIKVNPVIHVITCMTIYCPVCQQLQKLF